MNAPSPLTAVAAAGGRFEVRGDRLRLTAREILPLTIVENALAEVRDWHRRHREALAHHRVLHPENEAAGIAWGELVNRWHRLHGEKVAEWTCAGCGALIGGREVLMLADSNRVHLDTLDCLLAYGRRWRGAATRALAAMGLEPPAEEGEEVP